MRVFRRTSRIALVAASCFFLCSLSEAATTNTRWYDLSTNLAWYVKCFRA
ncbi:hypothetical protein [Lentzea sp. CA-135723]